MSEAGPRYHRSPLAHTCVNWRAASIWIKTAFCAAERCAPERREYGRGARGCRSDREKRCPDRIRFRIRKYDDGICSHRSAARAAVQKLRLVSKRSLTEINSTPPAFPMM